jgi:hypothetical protein
MIGWPKCPKGYSLLEGNFKELDGWGVKKWHESPRAMDSQRDLDIM